MEKVSLTRRGRGRWRREEVINGELRKSCRLEEKRNAVAEAKLDPQADPIGTLCVLPKEMLHNVFSHLEAEQLSSLCLVSRAMCEEILAYITIPSTRNKLLFNSYDKDRTRCCSSKVLNDDRTLGFLIKRATFLHPTKERLKILHDFTCMIRSCELCDPDKPMTCWGLNHFGRLLRTLIAGWGDLECQRVFKYVCNGLNLDCKMKAILTSPPGKEKLLEIEVKCICRRVLLDPSMYRSEGMFWLTQILKPWPPADQARLLYVLYGPYCERDGHVLWECMLGSRPVRDTCLLELSSALHLLQASTSNGCNKCDVKSIIAALSVLPNKWYTENLVRFLIQCGENICTMVLGSIATEQPMSAFATRIVFMSIVCEKDGYKMSWLVNNVKKIYRSFTSECEMHQLLHKITCIYKDVTMNLVHSLTADIPEQDMELNFLLNAQGSFLKETMSLAFSPMLTSDPFKPAQNAVARTVEE